MIDQESEVILRGSVKLWNDTERIVKQAEQLRGELVVPAISELRYAGRKLVDFVLSTMQGESETARKKHIYDYEQCCIRARHDAVDAAVMYMKRYYVLMVRTFGIDIIHEAYPHHLALSRAIRVVEQRVALSREERQKRNDLYTELNETHLADLIAKFQELVDSEEIIKGLRRTREREREIAKWSLWAGIGGLVLAVVGIAVGVALAT